jgi:hypothetical protein
VNLLASILRALGAVVVLAGCALALWINVRDGGAGPPSTDQNIHTRSAMGCTLELAIAVGGTLFLAAHVVQSGFTCSSCSWQGMKVFVILLGIPVVFMVVLLRGFGEEWRRMNAPEKRLNWLREGDHRAFLERAIDQCAKEHGGKPVGEPSTWPAKQPNGAAITGFSARGAWWLEYMGVHGKDWIGPLDDDRIRDITNPRPPLGA